MEVSTEKIANIGPAEGRGGESISGNAVWVGRRGKVSRRIVKSCRSEVPTISEHHEGKTETNRNRRTDKTFREKKILTQLTVKKGGGVKELKYLVRGPSWVTEKRRDRKVTRKKSHDCASAPMRRPTGEGKRLTLNDLKLVEAHRPEA